MPNATKTIKKTGGDYSTITAWEAASATTSGYWKGVISDDENYDEAVTFSGGSTTVSKYVWLTVDAANRHSGATGTSGHARNHYSGGTNENLLVEQDFTRIEYLDIKVDKTTQSHEAVRIGTADNVLISRCVVSASTVATEQDGIYTGNTQTIHVSVDHCAVHGFGRGGIHAQLFNGNNSQEWWVDSCTIWDCGGFNQNNDCGGLIGRDDGNTLDIDVFNTVIVDCSVGAAQDFQIHNGATNWDGTHNADSDGSLTDASITTSAQQNLTATDVTQPSGSWAVFNDITTNIDLRPLDDSNGNLIVDRGVDRTASTPDARQDFSFDIADQTITGSFAIGAGDEAPAAPLNTTPEDTETGSGVDVGGFPVRDPLEGDTGAGADANDTVTVTVADADTGAGVDAGEGVTVPVADADTGAGVDAGENVTVPIADADTGTSVETQIATFETILTIAVVADATIREGQPDNNYGGTTILDVDGDLSKRDFMLKFDVDGIGSSTVTDARVKLYCINASSFGGEFLVDSNTSWVENTITWNNAPSGNLGSAGFMGSIQVDDIEEFELTSWVTADGLMTIRVAHDPPTSDGGGYKSKEHGANAPELVVTIATEVGGSTPEDSDTGAGAEAGTLTATIADADTGAGADTAPSITFADADTGAGVDAGEAVDKTASDADTGAGADTEVTITAPFAAADTGAGADANDTVTATLAEADTGAGADTNVTLTVTISGADTGAGADGGEDVNVGGVSKDDADTGAGADIDVSLPATVAGADTGAGADTDASITAPFADADTGAGADIDVSITVPLADADTGAGADTEASLPAAVAGADTGADAEAGTLTATIAGADTGAGVDAGENVDISDVAVNDADTGAGVDIDASLTVPLPDADTGTGVDGGEVVDDGNVQKDDADTGTGVDTNTPTAVTAADGDVGFSTSNEAGLTVTLIVTDRAFADDSAVPYEFVLQMPTNRPITQVELYPVDNRDRVVNMLMGHFGNLRMEENLWLHANGTISEQQPNLPSNVVKQWAGGHKNILSPEDQALLEAAGYTVLRTEV